MTENLDEITPDAAAMVPEGFPGQRMLVVPRGQIAAALRTPGTSGLLVTDCGFFPDAEHHGRSRQNPIGEAVVIACVQGRGWCETPSGSFPVRAGQVAVVPPGVPHRYWADEGDPWTVWWLHLDGSGLAALLEHVGMTASAPVRTFGDLYRIVGLIREVVQVMERDLTQTSLLAASGAAWHLLALLATSRAPSDARGAAVERAAEYLRGHLEERIAVAQLASMAQLSPSHFSAMFKRRFGISVVQYQTQLRMARARELLDLTERPIARIAEETGYPDPFYFSRTFKKVHGVMPSAYRRRAR